MTSLLYRFVERIDARVQFLLRMHNQSYRWQADTIDNDGLEFQGERTLWMLGWFDMKLICNLDFSSSSAPKSSGKMNSNCKCAGMNITMIPQKVNRLVNMLANFHFRVALI
jgi:hypothetical protein